LRIVSLVILAQVNGQCDVLMSLSTDSAKIICVSERVMATKQFGANVSKWSIGEPIASR
jgi:hypothetical protein